MKFITDLTEAELDYYVGIAEQIDRTRLAIRKVERGEELICVLDIGTPNETRYSPSTNILLGWPIMIKNGIGIKPISDAGWQAKEYIDGYKSIGTDPLIEAMRCIVSATLGDIVATIEVSKCS